MIGLYIHIPFCHARCGYCDFVTFTGKEDKIDQYVEDLCEEMLLWKASPQPSPLGRRRDEVSGEAISTVFFGGGTPSVLEPRHLQKIFQSIHEHFPIAPDAEITLEANPESITLEKAIAWKEVGINRLSIGLQVFDNTLLKKIDRLHTVEDFLAAYRAVREAGFENVSIDLIYGFDGQTLESWLETLKSTAALNPEHLSLYALKIEEHTPFAAQGLRIDDDLEAEMYERARTYLRDQGYDHYEISNFSRSGKVCRHNLIYWRQEDYLGLGVGAVGCVDGLRWENHKNLHDYHKDISAKKLPRILTERLNPKTRRFERLMLGLRLREGFEWPETNPEWLSHRASLAARGLLEEIRPGTWRIPDKTVALTNQVLLPFVP
jgi:oxygen-independent coproporphyrinogen-3 oxidase